MLKFTRNLFKIHTSPFKRLFSTNYDDFAEYSLHPRVRDQGSNVNCLILHPILYPNLGPQKELNLAEEAIGLAKSLYWDVSKGPYWKEINGSEENDSMEESEDEKERPGRGKRGRRFVPKEGDYVYTDVFKGIYEKGGKLLDLETSEEEDDLFDEWKNHLLRESIAKSSLIKVRQTSNSTFFTSGKVTELGKFIQENEINAVFINSDLNALQIRNLETQWTQMINSNLEPLDSQGNEKNQGKEIEETEKRGPEKRVKVFDRFSIILQIFAKRAHSRVAKLQTELAFLNYMKTKLVRDGSTFSGLYDIFRANLMRAQEIKLEVKGGKQKGGFGKLAGQGETQLEIERRLISDREAKIKKELQSEVNNRQKAREKRKNSLSGVPTIALIGYTNAGKSALMNRLTNANVVSEDRLFQTLNTVSRKVKLQSGQLGVLFDTIGFITNLPHELIESFKSTLEEVQDADIVLHIRDVCHPNSEDQKQTVLAVLRDLGFDESFYTQKMVEVWNKIDLLENPLDEKAIQDSEVPVVPISALMGTNCDKLIDVITSKASFLMGKKAYKFVHAPEYHDDRINWLYKNANIVGVDKFKYDNKPSKGFPSGKITFEATVDEITYKKYETTFFEKEEKNEKGQKDKVPEDWLKGSKSFFERRKEEQERKKALEMEKQSSKN